ncbi:DUF3800 domain-containing protein [Blastococcus sp. CT_GayMR16]|nr:DUF3800 domain-containing protein [Blastococcus sp. CT_GayMR16]
MFRQANSDGRGQQCTGHHREAPRGDLGASGAGHAGSVQIDTQLNHSKCRISRGYGPRVTSSTPPLLRTYVDETGDRGRSGKSSRFFAMVGVTIADEDDHLLRSAVQTARQLFGVPSTKPLHWADHVKTFARRQAMTSLLVPVPALVNIVIFEKASIPTGAVLLTDQSRFYNYAAGMLMERILLTAKYWAGGPRDVIVNFGHVRGFNHQETQKYFNLKEQQDPAWVPWARLHGQPKFLGMGSLDGLQAADQYAGMLSAAMVADPYGGYEEHHLLAIRHRIRRNPQGKCEGFGFKAMVGPATLQSYPWWPAGGL